MISAGFKVDDCGPKDSTAAHVLECRKTFEARDNGCAAVEEDAMLYEDCMSDAWISSQPDEFKDLMTDVSLDSSHFALMKEAVEKKTWNGEPLGGPTPPPDETPPDDETPPEPVDFTADIAAACKEDPDCISALTKVTDAAMEKYKDEENAADKVKENYIVKSQSFEDKVYTDAGISKPEHSHIVMMQGATPPDEGDDDADEAKGEKGIADKWVEFGLYGGYLGAGISNELNDFEGVPTDEQPRDSKLKGGTVGGFAEFFLVGMFNKGYSINGFNAGLGVGFGWAQMEDFKRSNGNTVTTDDSLYLNAYGVAEYAFKPWISASLRLGLNYSWNKVMMGPAGARKQGIPAFMGQLGLNVMPVNHLVLGVSGMLIAGNTNLAGETVKDETLSTDALGSNSSILGGAILGKVGIKF